ncbi:phosphogluconate dehydratase, partial [Lentzea sp. PSKA42]|nr:phosphogluconate dehydratase [Lentzea indica]
DATAGTLEVHVSAEELASRPLVDFPPTGREWTGTGRELFAALRRTVGPADRGATVFGPITADHFAPVTHH